MWWISHFLFYAPLLLAAALNALSPRYVSNAFAKKWLLFLCIVPLLQMPIFLALCVSCYPERSLFDNWVICIVLFASFYCLSGTLQLIRCRCTEWDSPAYADKITLLFALFTLCCALYKFYAGVILGIGISLLTLAPFYVLRWPIKTGNRKSEDEIITQHD